MLRALEAAYRRVPAGVRGRLRGLLARRLRGLFEAQVLPGIRMDLDPWEWSQQQLRRGAAVEPRTRALFARILRPGDTYLDVGAHVGLHTLVAGRLVGPGGRVIAVEPQPYNCAKVLTNWSINGMAHVIVYP